MRSPWRETPRRRVGWLALIAAVIVAHALFALRVAASVIGWQGADEPRRIDVTLVQELAPAAPPPAAPLPPPAPPAPPGVRAVHAASAPRPAASVPEPAASSSREALQAEALALAASVGAAEQAFSAAAAASAAQPASAASAALAAASAPVAGPPQPALDWPPSTRLTYALSGQFRNGPLYGDAVVEWRRDGTHYQVAFDFHVSPFFDQHMFSDGQIADDGLRPQHYDEWRKFMVGEPRTRKMEFAEDDVLLANGNRVPRLPQSQDPASQFVQFVWMFTVHPEWLERGHIVEMPLALPNNLRRWQYEVGELETLALPFGTIAATHLKPIGPRRPNEYPFEIWTAPTLQYLPVRIHVQLDETNFADLALTSRPLQAVRPPRPAAEPASDLLP